jgi:hypothetical protein
MDWLMLWRLRRRHQEWMILRLQYVGGFRAYRMRPDHDLHAATLQSLAGCIARCDALDKGPS